MNGSRFLSLSLSASLVLALGLRCPCNWSLFDLGSVSIWSPRGIFSLGTSGMAGGIGAVPRKEMVSGVLGENFVNPHTR